MRAAVDVRHGEGWPLALLIAQAWCMGVSNTFLDAAATSLFLTHFPIDRLPWVYIASAVTGVSLGFVISRLETRLTPRLLLGGTTAMLVATVGGMYATLLQTDAPWLGVALMMWKDVQYILSAMSLWAAAGIIFDLRQGKRLFGIVGAGDILAIIAGGLAVPHVASALGASNLLGVAAIAQVGCLLTFAMIARRFDAGPVQHATPVTPARERRAARAGFRSMLRDPFLRPLFAISVLSYLAYYFVDYGFYARVQTMYPSAEAVASFYGYFLAATGVVNLLSNLFLSGRILTRFGVPAALLVLPALVGIGVGVSLVSIVLGLGAMLVASVIATKLADEVLRKSIEGPSYRVLYQPLRRTDRLRVQALRESVVEPFAIGLSGVVLLILTKGFAIPVTSLVWALAGIVVIWIAVAQSLGRGYVTVLRAAIGRRKLSPADTGLEDETTHRLLREYLDRASGAELVYALKVLESRNGTDYDERIVTALEHPDAVVREFAIDAAARRGLVAATPSLRRILNGDDSARLRGRAAVALGKVAGDAGAHELVSKIEDQAPDVRRGALTGLLAHAGIAATQQASLALERMAASPATEDRLVAAHVLAAVYRPGFRELLLSLLQDADGVVARAAILAAGRSGDSRFIPYLLVRLEHPSHRQVAAAALIALGDLAVDPLTAVLSERNAARTVRRQVARVLGRIGTSRSLAALAGTLEVPDVVDRAATLAALEQARWKPSAGARVRLLALLDREIADVARLYAGIAACAEPALDRVRDALTRETRAGRERILSLLTIILSDQGARDAKSALSSEIPERRAQGLEMLETLLPRTLRPRVTVVLDELAPDEKLRRLERTLGIRRLLAHELLADLVTQREDGRVWLRAVAIRAAALRGLASVREGILRAREDREPLIRETAVWAGDFISPSRTT